jgi:hypothetical protein
MSWGMWWSVALWMLQVAVPVFAWLTEPDEDPAFEGDKLGYRS